jgi:hypothetical protein
MSLRWRPSLRREARQRFRALRSLEQLESRDLLSLVVFNVNTVEGQPYNNMLVASFNLGDIEGSKPSDFSATINWGDGHTSTGNVTAGGPGFEVFGSNTYLTPTQPSKPDTVTVNVTGLNSSSATALGSANVAFASLTSIGIPISPSKNAPFALNVASFQSANTFVTASNFAATINWGDSTPSTTGLISSTATPGTFNVQGSHVFSQNGTFLITTTITYLGSQITVANGSASVGVSAPVITPNGQTLVATQNVAIPSNTLVGTFFYNPPAGSPAPSFTASINWGDGHTTLGDVTPVGSNLFDVTGGNTYQLPGKYPVNVTVQDQLGHSGTIPSTAVVNSSIPATFSGTTFTYTPNVPLNVVVGTFSDPNPLANKSNIMAVINWGDGHTSNGTITGPDANGLFMVAGTNTYAKSNPNSPNGSYTVTATITGPSGESGTATSTALLTGATSPVLASPVTFAVTPGTPFTGTVATFTDSNPAAMTTKPIAQITWGDGHASQGTVTGPDANGVFTVTGTNTYQSFGTGTYPVTVTITDPSGQTGTAKSTALVTQFTINASPVTFAVVPRTPFTGTVATFTDTNPAAITSKPTAQITWGDGHTSQGTVTGPDSNGVFTVTGTNTYAAPNSKTSDGSYMVNVNIKGPSGETGQATSTARVTQFAISATPVVFSVIPGTTFTDPVATFTDSNPAALSTKPTVAINWGNGFVSQGTVTGPDANGVFTVSGSVTYFGPNPNDAHGNYPVSVTIVGPSGESAVVFSVAQVTVPPTIVPTFTGGLDTTAGNGHLSPTAAFSSTNRPAFTGTANPYAIVQLFARPLGVDATLSLGQAVANSQGQWSLGTSGPLADGIYMLTAAVTPPGGSPSAELLQNNSELVVDTVPPRVVGVTAARGGALVSVFFRDDLSGMNSSSLVNTLNYTLIGGRGLAIRPASATLVTTGSLPTDTQEVVLTIPGSPRFRARFRNLRVTAFGITDNAGNLLASNPHVATHALAVGRAASNVIVKLGVHGRR